MKNLNIDLIQSCKESGMSCKDVSLISGQKITTIYVFCKRHGVKLPRAARGGQNVKDLIGEKFGSLRVLERAGSERKLATWKCLCKCGNTAICVGSDLRQGKSKTCGCRIGIKNKRNWQGYGDIPKSYWSSLVNNARQRDLAFEIDPEYLQSLWLKQDEKCKLSGLTISLKGRTASVDRINSSKGYVRGNVQWIHKDINKMKSNFYEEVFIELCLAVSQHKEKHNGTTRHDKPRVAGISSNIQSRSSKKLSV